MNFKVENNKNHTTFRCSFEKLDSLVAPELKALFLDQSNKGSNTFVVDLSQIKYCDSSGLSALLVGNRILKDKKLADAYSSLQKIHDTYARVIGNDAIQIRQRLEKSMMADLKRKVKNWDEIYSAL